MTEILKKTPKDVTEFEREQLRFLSATANPAGLIAEINPSLAWLPILIEKQIIRPDSQFAPWIEKNFSDPEAIREVADNLRFFGPDTADVLEFRLNQTADLPDLLGRTWRLIIRHMRLHPRGKLWNEWFDLEPRILRGEHSAEVINRLVDVITPKLVVKRQSPWFDHEERPETSSPADLVAIDFEVEEGITDEEILVAWPEQTPVDIDEELIRRLTQSLGSTIVESIEAGVEATGGFGVTDSDVPSIAKHPQNELRSGFLTITRVLAELWLRLRQKDLRRALTIMDIWASSHLRLIKRLALFAAADPFVPAARATEVFLSIPPSDLFTTGASVEAYRVARSRWNDFSPEERTAIERRIAEGPSRDTFREGAETERHIDRARFDFLKYLELEGLELGEAGRSLLRDISSRHPNWKPRPQEQAGFHIWHSEGAREESPFVFSDTSDDSLIATARAAREQQDMFGWNPWDAFCSNEPHRAFAALENEAREGRWEAWTWRPFLWAIDKLGNAESLSRVAQLLLGTPKEVLSELSDVVAWTLEQKAKDITEEILWPLWDRIEFNAPEIEEADLKDALTSSLNSRAGHLAGVLLKRLSAGHDPKELPPAIEVRINKLMIAEGMFGRLARVRLASELSFLFERAPKWTAENLVPLFYWSSPEGPAVWGARKYSNYIGSPELIALTKEPFLELFRRSDRSDDDLRVYSDWLVSMVLANQSRQAGYPISATEARSALRQTSTRGLSSVAHRLASTMQRAMPEDKISVWTEVVGPVFQSVWPLDAELQTASANSSLIQILRAAGEAFPQAAEAIIPFIRPEDPARHTNVHSLSRADDLMYKLAPDKMLDLLDAIVGEAPPKSVYGLAKALHRLSDGRPSFPNNRRFKKLARQAVPD